MSSGNRAVTVKLGTSTELADPEVDRAAAKRIRLLAIKHTRPEVVDHIQQRVTSSKGGVLALVPTVLMHADPGGGEETPRGGELRRREVVVADELQVANTPLRCFALPKLEANVHAGAHLDRCTARLTVALV